ncbi:helix-turn-helix domain-containing protein [Streptomyces sp. NPDC020412]|uniref:helix-turn-helix domain-containing protein n=1 Tax=Streptomyces sp. NPDC020412 TaxID=3365073 RepID=UPI0037AEC3B9
MSDGRTGARVSAWRPPVTGIAESFHAYFADHAYPVHTHDTWTLMILDDGCVDFGLDRHRHGAAGLGTVVLLPPGVPHDGRTVGARGFRKRVLYLEGDVLPERLTGAAVDIPVHRDVLLHHRIGQLHAALCAVPPAAGGGAGLEAESRLALVRERLLRHLRALPAHDPGPPSGPLAGALRELLDSRIATGLSMAEAAGLLHAHPTHLIRAFTQRYGIAPHAYLTGRRIDRARRLLLAGQRPAEVATSVGFYDQAHLNRHFTRHLRIPPARYAASHGPRGATAPARGNLPV